MEIRKFYYTVRENEIEPSTERRVGVQGEHRATQLVFKLDGELYEKITKSLEDGEMAIYRFDCRDGAGEMIGTDPKELTCDTVTFELSESLTRNGGKISVYLVITKCSKSYGTELEILSLPARLRLENVPFRRADETSESLSTLSYAAVKSAGKAEKCAEAAVKASEVTALAQRSLEKGSKFFFDGGNSAGTAKVDITVDTELNKSSSNPLANSAVAAELEKINDLINAAVQKAIAQKNEKDHPKGSFFTTSETTDPATLYGGTWERLEGVFIWGVADGETAGITGGEKTHTLTVKELPKANLEIKSESGDKTGLCAVLTPGQDGVLYGFIDSQTDGSGAATSGEFKAVLNGENQPHNNMPPFYGAHIWRRTA